MTPDQIRTFLPALLGLPVVAAIVLRLVPGTAARGTALGFAIAHLVLTGAIVFSGALGIQEDPSVDRATRQGDSVFAPRFVPGDPLPNGKQSFATRWDMLPFYETASDGRQAKIGAAQFYIGLDGLNVWLVALASVMMLPVVLISWDSIRDRTGPFYSWLFLLQAGVVGVFLSFDILLFYVCFELTLIPLLFLIGGWGAGPNRREAARKLFLFTLAGGLMTLIGIAGLVAFVYSQSGFGGTPRELTFSIPRLADVIQARMAQVTGPNRELWLNAQAYFFVALAIGFAVKIPLVPLHSWLPGAYSEAPIGVTVMLSALLAKMGTFGLVRICLPLCPDATLAIGTPLLGVLGVIGIVYGAMCAYAQSDIRRLVAYSSISHLGFCVLAVVSFNAAGVAGGVLHMVNHGLSTGAMFLVVGMLAHRYRTTQIGDYSGLWSRLPELTFFMMVFSLASVGLPGLNNFVSEMVMLGGVFDMRNKYAYGVPYAIFAGFGIFLSAWYTLTMVRRAFFGPAKEPPTPMPVTDLNARERWAVVPLAILCLALGVLAQPVLDVMSRDVSRLAVVADEARTRQGK